MYDYVIDKNIFPSFVSSCIPQIDMMTILEEVYEIEFKYKSENVSNEGGYHSPTFVGTSFSSLYDVVKQFSNDILQQKNLGLTVENIEYWCNINKSYNYNVMHSHGRADLIGIYYVTVPPNSGDLVLLRNDGSQYSSLYENRNDCLLYTSPSPRD